MTHFAAFLARRTAPHARLSAPKPISIVPQHSGADWRSQTASLEDEKGAVQAQLAATQSELEGARRAYAAAAAVKRQQDKGAARVSALEAEKAAMIDKQVSLCSYDPSAFCVLYRSISVCVTRIRWYPA